MYARGFIGDQFAHAALHPELCYWLADPLSDWHVFDRRPVDGQQMRTVADSLGGYREFGGYYRYWLELDGRIPDNVRLVRFERLDTDFPIALEEVLGYRGDMTRENVGPKSGERDVFSYYQRTSLVDPLDVVESKFAWCFEQGLYKRRGRE